MSLKLKSMNDLIHRSIKVDEDGNEGGRTKREPDLQDEHLVCGGEGGGGGGSPEYVENREDMEAMAKFGLPTEFSLRGGGAVIKEEAPRKGEKKKTFYCDVCEIELNSHDTMTSHVKGVRHTKKTLLHEEKRVMAEQEGVYIPEKLVRQVAPTRAQPKKIPMRLHERLREDNNPLVGLRFVEEVMACSNAEMEPQYECHLCGNTGTSTGMQAHLLGRPHREKFLQSLHPEDPAYLELSKDALLRAVNRLRENNHLDSITTIYSDELYPWPAGKAPWSIEQGGTGCVPTTANYNVTKKMRKKAILKGVPVEKLVYDLCRDDDDVTEVDEKGASVLGPGPGIGRRIPSVEEVGAVKGQRQMQEFYSLALALAEKASEFQSANAVSHQHGEKVRGLLSLLQSNMTVLMNVPVRESGASEGTSRGSGRSATASQSRLPSHNSSFSTPNFVKKERGNKRRDGGGGVRPLHHHQGDKDQLKRSPPNEYSPTSLSSRRRHREEDDAPPSPSGPYQRPYKRERKSPDRQDSSSRGFSSSHSSRTRKR